MKEYIRLARQGFLTLDVPEVYQNDACKHLDTWLTSDEFADYKPQIIHLIEQSEWNYLLDCFFRVIPFGTWGRRWEVWIGPNRINTWTICASAQGHSQYLIKQYGDEAKQRWVVLAFDVREFFGNAYLDDSIPNPVKHLKCEDIATSAAQVYAANGIQVYLFDSFRTTPELSFAIRHLGAIGGDVFSASHNPPDHNGKKVYDLHGWQLIPPHDENLVNEVVDNVDVIHTIPFSQAVESGMIEIIGSEVDEAYYDAVSQVSLSRERSLKIAYTPLHGCWSTSITPILTKLGFTVHEDPHTSNPSGKFENITFNIPNPEVIQSFETPLKFARSIDADILLNSDPDADRIGIMCAHDCDWEYINGNEIGVMLSVYALEKRKGTFYDKGVFIKTMVTTDLITKIAQVNDCEIIGDLLVGFKYIGEEMNTLSNSGRIHDLILASEESHGYLTGDYARDKDAVPAAIWLCELAAELKKDSKTLIDYLHQIYETYGFYSNHLTEIRMLGATGVDKIRQIQSDLRENPRSTIWKYTISHFEDCTQRKPIVSSTDASSKDVLVYQLDPPAGFEHIKVTVRPSGTEPKIKMYFEIWAKENKEKNLKQIQEETEALLKDVEKSFMNMCYKILDVDFPDRGFLVFWQLPLDIKLRYFEIEPMIEPILKFNLADREPAVLNLLDFLGSNPIEKVDSAFREKYGKGIRDYLGI